MAGSPFADVVDMLTPGKSAAETLRMGDTILLWDGIPLVNPDTGKQRKIATVVDSSLDAHTVVVERSLKPLSTADEEALTKEALRRSEAYAAQAEMSIENDETAKQPWVPQTQWSAEDNWRPLDGGGW